MLNCRSGHLVLVFAITMTSCKRSFLALFAKSFKIRLLLKAAASCRTPKRPPGAKTKRH
jgi:hypothetical protein